jgi:hypothetical protein
MRYQEQVVIAALIGIAWNPQWPKNSAVQLTGFTANSRI